MTRRAQKPRNLDALRYQLARNRRALEDLGLDKKHRWERRARKALIRLLEARLEVCEAEAEYMKQVSK